jgi:hypothetical protein
MSLVDITNLYMSDIYLKKVTDLSYSYKDLGGFPYSSNEIFYFANASLIQEVCDRFDAE